MMKVSPSSLVRKILPSYATGDALKVAQTISDRVPSDETSMTNAAEAINICRANSLATPTFDFSTEEPETATLPAETATLETTATP